MADGGLSKKAVLDGATGQSRITYHASRFSPSSIVWLIALMGLISLGGYVWMASAASLTRAAEAVGNYIWLFAALFAIYLIACLCVLRWDKRLPARSTLIVIGVVAVVSRGVLIFAPPTLSNDIYRYVWDGRVQAAGISPYAYPPIAPEVKELRPADYWIWHHINRKSAITIYPAGAEMFFAGIYKLQPDSLEGTKAAMAVVDLGSCVVLALLLWQLAMPVTRVLVYAWAPLPIVEFASSGHVEALAVLWILMALLAGVVAVRSLADANLRQARLASLLAMVCLAGAALVKLIPLMLLAAWVRRFGWRLALFCVLLVAGVSTWFIWYHGGYISNFLVTYLKDEQFNSPLYASISSSLGFLFGVPDGAVRIGLALIFLAVIMWVFLHRDHHLYSFISKSFLLVSAYFLLATSLHPWYATWLLLFVPLFLPPGGLTLWGGNNQESEGARWLRGDYGPALAALLYCGLTFGGYAVFASRVSIVPAEFGAAQLVVTLGLGIGWPLTARIRLHRKARHSQAPAAGS